MANTGSFSDIAGKRDEIKKSADHLVDEAGATMRKTAEKAGRKAEAAYDAMASRADGAARYAGQQVRDYPITSLAVAFAAGAVFASLIRR